VLGSPTVSRWWELVISRFWTITSDPRYPGYKTLIILLPPQQRVKGFVLVASWKNSKGRKKQVHSR
jgi:hypothetical protein